MDRVSALAATQQTSLSQGLADFSQGAPARISGKIQGFLALLDELRSEAASLPLDQLIGRTLERTGYMDGLAKEGTPEAEARRDNLLELMTSARDFHAANEGDLGDDRSELELFLDQVALISDLDRWEDRSDRVSLMTVHSSKGLEFPVVFLVGMEERIFPHASSAGDGEGIEEERRLCYVAMTRAMEQLNITHAAERRRFGERSLQSPSRFLDEIPGNLVEVLGRGTASRRRGRSAEGSEASFDYSYSQESADVDGEVQSGMRVRHPVFGDGVILEVIGGGVNQKLKIRFARVGVKTVMLRFANLELA